MEGEDLKRKLATILVADIVGYSRLTANDEDWTIRALGEFRGVVDGIIQKHEGRIFSTGGDSILAEFASPVEAVRCSVDFQEAARSRNLMQPRDRQLRYRIGINLGDVMIRGNDLLGDGVNVAARLEGIAEPGGICVSGTVWDHINGKLSIGYVDIGEQAVKNIPRPVRAYHLRPDGGEAGIVVADDPGFRPGQPRGRGNRGALFGALGGALAVAIAAVLVWAFWLRPPAPDRQRPSETISAQNTAPAPVIPPAAPPPTAAAPAPPPRPEPAPQQAAAAPAQNPESAAPQPAPAAQPAPAPSAAPARLKTFRDCPSCPEMVVIPAGSFRMGAGAEEAKRLDVPEMEAARDRPQHQVTFAKPFAIAKFDVTRAEFAAFARTAHFQPHRGCQTFENGAWLPRLEGSWENPGFPQTDRDPVVCTNMIEIDAFLAWLKRTTGKDYRLPSEAEWEYAARGGTTTAYYWGDDPAQACTYENVGDEVFREKHPHEPGAGLVVPCKDGFAETAPVGSFKPNPFGLYDMLGNVGVLTADCWNESYAGAPTDGSAWSTGECGKHPVRKVAFGAVRHWAFRAANRYPEGGLVKRNRIGFRVALTLE